MSSGLRWPCQVLKRVFTGILHIFCSLSCDGLWALEGVIQKPHLGLGAQPSPSSALGLVLSLCPRCREASLSKTETSRNLRLETQTSRRQLGKRGYVTERRQSVSAWEVYNLSSHRLLTRFTQSDQFPSSGALNPVLTSICSHLFSFCKTYV